MSRVEGEMPDEITRRKFLGGAAAFGLAAGASRLPWPSTTPRASTVSVARCDTYGPELVTTLDRMFDELGGLGRIAKGRTVAVKVNLTGPSWCRLGTRPAGEAHWVHPRVLGAVVHLLDRAGAQRVRLLEGGYATDTPLDEYVYQAGWDAGELLRAGRRVELVNTNAAPPDDAYARFDVPGGGMLFSSYLLHPAYRDCDVFVSLAKLKDHTTTGVTLSMKNCFGNVPTTVYGDHSPGDRPDARPRSGRNFVFHDGRRQPSSPAAPEIDPTSPRHEGYRIPRVVVDVCAARPIDLAIVDGIDTMGGTEGPWSGGEACHAGVLVAGTNCVNTDAVCTAVMGYDPMARAGEKPFVWSDNVVELAERAGLGSRDLGRIEVAGTPIAAARYDFAPLVRSRRPRHVSPYPAKGAT